MALVVAREEEEAGATKADVSDAIALRIAAVRNFMVGQYRLIGSSGGEVGRGTVRLRAISKIHSKWTLGCPQR